MKKLGLLLIACFAFAAISVAQINLAPAYGTTDEKNSKKKNPSNV